MDRDKLKKKINAGENSSAILLSPAGANASQDKSANSVQPAGDSISEILARLDKRKKEERKVFYNRNKPIVPKFNSKEYKIKMSKTIKALFDTKKIKHTYPTLENPPVNKKYFTSEEKRKANTIKQKKYWKNHPEKRRIKQQAYKARKRGAGKLSIKTIQLVYEDNIKKYGTLTCYLCLKPIEFKKDHLEHKIPLSRGGTNIKENLDIACAKCNWDKNSRTEKEYRLDKTRCRQHPDILFVR